MTRGQYVPLSVNYPDDAALLEAGVLASLIWPRLVALAGKHYKTDGVITMRQVDRDLGEVDDWLRGIGRSGALLDALDALVRVGLLEVVEDPPAYRMRSWLGWNRPAAEVEAERERRLEQDRERARRYREGKKTRSDVTESSRVTKRDVTPYSSSSSSAPEAPAAAAATAAAAADASGDDKPMRELVDAIAREGLVVDWHLSEAQRDLVEAAIARAGVPALVAYAKKRHRPDAPAFSARAWLGGWSELRPRLTAVQADACPRHPGSPRRQGGVCAGCYIDQSPTGQVGGA